MEPNCDVSVLNRLIGYEVKIPVNCMADFILEFGKTFPIHGSAPGQSLRPVDTYRGHKEIDKDRETDKDFVIFRVSISVYTDTGFYAFLESFCKKRQLSMHFPENLRYKR